MHHGAVTTQLLAHRRGQRRHGLSRAGAHEEWLAGRVEEGGGDHVRGVEGGDAEVVEGLTVDELDRVPAAAGERGDDRLAAQHHRLLERVAVDGEAPSRHRHGGHRDHQQGHADKTLANLHGHPSAPHPGVNPAPPAPDARVRRRARPALSGRAATLLIIAFIHHHQRLPSHLGGEGEAEGGGHRPIHRQGGARRWAKGDLPAHQPTVRHLAGE